MKRQVFKNVILIGLCLIGFNSFAGHLSGFLQFSARMNGTQEVPAVTTNGLGVASFILSENRDSLCVNINTTGLSGAIDGIHIHEGMMGMNGGVALDLSGFIQGNQVSGVITGSMLTPILIEKMLDGMLYVNVHTAMNPNGEIRGQIKLETDASYVATLNGAQQVPALTTNAYGLGVFNLALHDGKLDIKVIVQGLSGAIDGAHLHSGAMGTNGGVVQDLGAGIMGNTIMLSVDPTAYLADLKAGNIYINIHTAANPGGEIRGQLMLPDALYFDAAINGAQQVPAVTTSAMGVASFELSKTFDQLTYKVVLDGLSGAIDGAHLHSGALGTNGGVLLDLTGGISGNMIMGTVSSAMLTNDIIHDLLTGNVYLNIHTAMNPNGEIRGQVYRLAREGYNILMDGAQEVPMVATSAYGGGMVSVGRDQMDAHFMMVAGGLSGTLDGAHFHNAAMGANGGVAFDLSSFFMNNGAYGYLKSTDGTPFNTASSVMFRNEEIYVNIHTAANPNGEIRGQIIRGEICSSATLVTDELSSNAIAIYPNPASGIVNLQFEEAKGRTIEVRDMTGKLVFSQKTDGQFAVIDISKLNAGVYQISSSDSLKTNLLMKD